MDRWIDTFAVLLFFGATAFVAVHSRGWVGTEQDVPESAAVESSAARVAAALPRLERHVASGSMRMRGAECAAEEELAEIAEIEAAIGDVDDPAIAVPLARGIEALRECVACTPEPAGCAAAARAFTIVEDRLALPRGASGI